MWHVIWLYIKLGILNELQYRANFFAYLFQSFLSLLVAFGGLGIVFGHTDDLNGWTASQIVAILGVYFLVGGFIGMFVQPSMERLMRDIQEGTLDYAILKPIEPQLHISVRQVVIWKLMDVIIGVSLLAISLSQSNIVLGLDRTATFALLLFCGVLIVYSFWLILATVAFWFVRVSNILVIFETVYEAGRWPVRIYPGWLQFVLTFLVPVAFAVTVPVEALTGQLTFASFLSALLLTTLMLLIARWFWQRGLRAYSGASA